MTWSSSSGAVRVDRHELYENGVLIYSIAPWILSASITGRGDGTYRYNVRACNSAGCSGFTADFNVTVLWPPGTPAAFNVPQDSGPNYTISWTPQPYGAPAPAGSGRSDRYDLNESTDGVAWPTNYSLTTSSKSLAGKPQGSRFYYRVRACNSASCSAYTAAKSVDVVSSLTTVIDQSLPAPTAPPQGSVGTIPGTLSTEGGAATYRIPIEVPPGRAGMQPNIALTYSSRNGNGIAGVGWSLSGTRSIYRCPRTLAQEGGNRTVQHDTVDRLCFDGQRLVADTLYGATDSEYRTEVDQFDRIRLKNLATGSWPSYFEVEHKSGRISQFEPVIPTSGRVPDVWYLVREFDRQGNCITYNYTTFTSITPSRPDPERVLESIVYTGTGSTTQRTCTTGADSRSVEFAYTTDREDKRTTYRFGVSSPMTMRLAAISTKVGAQYVRRYELGYVMSSATRRSLLQTVKLCAGGTCGAEQLPPTTFSYQQESRTFDMWNVQFKGQPLGTDWRAGLVADFDGDGRRDHLYDQLGPGAARTRYLEATSCPQPVPFDASSWGLNFIKFASVLRLETSQDIDNDGRADVMGIQNADALGNGILSFSKATCTGLSPTNTTLPLSADATTRVNAIDYDGDGIIDLRYQRYVRATNSNEDKIFRRRTKSATDWANSDVIVFPLPPPNASMGEQMTRDINGDGLVDTVFDATSPAGGAFQPTQVTFFKGVGQAFVSSPLLNLGGPAGAFGDPANNQRRWIDVNGDGLPDIYEPGSIWLNQGGPIGNQMFRRVTVSMAPGVAALDPKRAIRAFVMDFDADGQDELMVPNVRIPAYEFCGGDSTFIFDDGSRALFCGADFDVPPGAGTRWSSYDKSVFQWNAYKFVEQSDGNYTMVLVPTNLQAPINTDVEPLDWDGDGLSDLRFFLVNGPDGFNNYPPTASLGPYISLERARAPDLLTGVTNGLGATASWVHQPLSLPGNLQAQVSGCDMPEPFYIAHNDDTTSKSPDYLYFTSTMWTVSRFDMSNGLGTAMNKTCYRYQDAMLNAEGRGFQGFKVIVAEEQMPPAAAEDASAGFPGCGGTCSPNNLRTTTQFHQEFPLTSKPKRMTVALAKSGSPLSETNYWWHKVRGTFGAWVVYSSGVLEKKFELAPPGAAVPLAKQMATVSEVDQISGENLRSCMIVNGGTPDPATPSTLTPRDVITRDTRVLQNDLTAWILGRPTSRELLSDFLNVPPALDETACPTRVTGTETWACSLAPPMCPSFTASQDAKVQTTNYTWNPDAPAAPVGSVRKLLSEQLVVRGAVEATTSYRYDQFGNVSSKQTTARDVSASLMTTYGYTADGYFASQEVNPVQHMATVTIDPATGLVTSRQAVQNGPATRTTYDFVGRVRSFQTDGMPSAQQGLSSYLVGSAVLRRQMFQAGAPIKTEYVDRLGRVIATGMEGFDGTEVLTKTDYNSRGIKVAEYQPSKNPAPGTPGTWDGASASPYSTQYSRIDALGRVGRKTVLRAASGLLEPGKGDSSLVTDYAYAVDPSGSGLITTITVSKPAAQGGALNMTRTYDRRGKLVATTQSVSAPTAHAIPANYFYDPAGNLRTIRDAAGNLLVASYDDLGRKKSVQDPDRGTWTYAWDGLGRLTSQTDARSVVVSYQYDGIGRLVQRLVKKPGDLAAVVESSWQYDLNSRFGTVGAMISNENAATGADNFHREYLYDPLWRPFRVTTHVPSSPATTDWIARDFAVEYGYDHNYGRLKAMSYPSGELVALDYDSRGNLVGETPLAADLTRAATPYRRVLGLSLRGQIALQDLGNGIREAAQYDDSTGMALELSATGMKETPPANCPTAQAPLVRQVDYTYDHFLNLARQTKQFHLRTAGTGPIQFNATCQPLGAAATETYNYDELQRLLGESRSWTGMTADPAPRNRPADRYAYDDLGNITTKDDYADLYTYGSSARTTGNAGPHAVVSVSQGGVVKATFSYDLNGNMVMGDGRTVEFDSLDRPITVTLAGVATRFRYAPDGSRYLQRTTGIPSSPTTKTVYYVDKDYERIDWPAATEEKTYIGPSVAIYRNGATREVRYLHLDRLGSTDAVTNAGAFEVVADAHGFDAFGKPRGRDWQWSGERLHTDSDYNKTTEHGFTKHEHLDDTYLIHMNGRVYDYRLGRFLSVDPIISNPANSQSINPYSYIGNNPLSGTDPTGYEECSPNGSCNGPFRPRDGTLTEDAKYSKVDVIAFGGPNSDNGGKPGQGPDNRERSPDHTNDPSSTGGKTKDERPDARSDTDSKKPAARTASQSTSDVARVRAPGGGIRLGNSSAQRYLQYVESTWAGKNLIAYLNSSPIDFVVYTNRSLPVRSLDPGEQFDRVDGVFGNLPGETNHVRLNSPNSPLGISVDIRVDVGRDLAAGLSVTQTLAHELIHAMLFDHVVTSTPLPEPFGGLHNLIEPHSWLPGSFGFHAPAFNVLTGSYWGDLP